MAVDAGEAQHQHHQGDDKQEQPRRGLTLLRQLPDQEPAGDHDREEQDQGLVHWLFLRMLVQLSAARRSRMASSPAVRSKHWERIRTWFTRSCWVRQVESFWVWSRISAATRSAVVWARRTLSRRSLCWACSLVTGSAEPITRLARFVSTGSITQARTK